MKYLKKILTKVFYKMFNFFRIKLNTRKIGWLKKGKTFEKEKASEEILSLLWYFCTVSVGISRADTSRKDCELCSPSRFIFEERDGECLFLGTGEIRVFSEDGNIFIAPNLIYHYVKYHGYKLPDIFIKALLTSPKPPSTSYFKKLYQLNVGYGETPSCLYSVFTRFIHLENGEMGMERTKPKVVDGFYNGNKIVKEKNKIQFQYPITGPFKQVYYHCTGYVHRDKDQISYNAKLIKRFIVLQGIFAIKSIYSGHKGNNHNMILIVDDEAAQSWTEKKVQMRWKQAFKTRSILVERYLRQETLTTEEVNQARETIFQWRKRLADIRWFMRCLNETIPHIVDKDVEKYFFWVKKVGDVMSDFTNKSWQKKEGEYDLWLCESKESRDDIDIKFELAYQRIVKEKLWDSLHFPFPFKQKDNW